MNVAVTLQNMPDLVLETIFTKLELPDLLSSMLVCKNWYRIINIDSVMPWKLICEREIPEEFEQPGILSPLLSYKEKVRAFCHSWNPQDCSVNIILSNSFTMYRKPILSSSDLARTKIGYSFGKHIWEITWIGPLGTNAAVGLSTKEAPSQCSGYHSLVGFNNQSWGWCLNTNDLWHSGQICGKYPLSNNELMYKPGEKLRLVQDSDNGIMFFEMFDEYLGIAFKDLPKTKLYPSVSTVYGDSKVSIVYIGNSFSQN